MMQWSLPYVLNLIYVKVDKDIYYGGSHVDIRMHYPTFSLTIIGHLGHCIAEYVCPDEHWMYP